jgi:predicted MFS family arabinose efflux permease
VTRSWLAPSGIPADGPGHDGRRHGDDRRHGPAPGAVLLSRDELTYAGYATLATWGWFLYGFGSLLPLLRAEQGISRTVTGLHSVALATGAVISGSLTVQLVRALRRRGTALLGLALLASGALALCLSRNPYLSLPSVLLVGTGGSILVNSVNASLSDHHGPAAAAALSEANAMAAGVGLVAPLAVGAGVGLGWGWRPAVLVIVVLTAGVARLLNRVPPNTPALDTILPRQDPGHGRLPPVFWLLAGTVVVCVGIEFVCTAWSADLLRTRTGLSPGAASAAVTAVVAGMAAGRLLIGRLALRLPGQALLLAALATTVLGWLVTWLVTTPWIAVVGLGVTGIGISGQYPLGISLALGSAPGQRDRATSKISLGIGLSAGLSPFLVGALADATSTHTAFVVVPALVTLALSLLGGSLLAGTARPGRPEVG